MHKKLPAPLEKGALIKQMKTQKALEVPHQPNIVIIRQLDVSHPTIVQGHHPDESLRINLRTPVVAIFGQLCAADLS